MFFILFILTADHASAQPPTGYFKTTVTIGRDSINAIRAKILSISNDLFQPYQFRGKNKITINYRQLDPVKISDGRKYPLVLVFHGSNAVGTNNTEQLGILAKFWAQAAIREEFPVYVIAPQFPVRSSNYQADATLGIQVSTPDACVNTALQLIDSLKKVLPVDGSRIYVMGMSMGGSSTINAIGLRPDLFAAGISISGVPAFNHLDVLKQTPLWIIHGNADDENKFDSDSLLYKKLTATKARYLRFWEVDALGHETFYKLYATREVPEWLFRLKRKPAGK